MTGISPCFSLSENRSSASNIRQGVAGAAKLAQISQSRPDSGLGFSHFCGESHQNYVRCSLLAGPGDARRAGSATRAEGWEAWSGRASGEAHPLPSEEGTSENGYLNAKARIWPWPSHRCHVGSTYRAPAPNIGRQGQVATLVMMLLELTSEDAGSFSS